MGMVLRLIVVGVVSSLVLSGSAAASAPHDGWGFGLADDDAIGSAVMPPPSIDNAMFDRLRPKTFRLQVYWDAENDPTVENDYIDRAKEEITRVREAGVEQVIVTFKRHGAEPSTLEYELAIKKVVDELKNYVDVWGPANEPNAGETWLGGVEGAQKLAKFNDSLIEVVDAWDPTALRTSPDFVEPASLENLTTYINAYLNAGGGWGHYIAFHPYSGVNANPPSLAGVDRIASLSPSGKPIWITEVGAFGIGGGHNDPQTVQNDRVHWMTTTLAGHSRVGRIYYYHMRGKTGAEIKWDTALLNNDLSSRPAWYTWCAASHGDQANHADCTQKSPTNPPNGDRVGVYRTSSANWYLTNWIVGGPPTDYTFNYGLSPDRPVAGDWDGNGKDSVGVYRATNAWWYLTNSTNSGPPTNYQFNYGLAGDWPVAGDWDGDGKDSVGVYRPSSGNWYLTNSTASGPPTHYTFNFGLSGDLPVAGDWNGDGKDSVGVYRPSTGRWFLTNSTAPGPPVNYLFGLGPSSGRPVAGDWNADGNDSVGVFQSSSAWWYLSDSISGYQGSPADYIVNYGLPTTDYPVAGDWNG